MTLHENFRICSDRVISFLGACAKSGGHIPSHKPSHRGGGEYARNSHYEPETCTTNWEPANQNASCLQSSLHMNPMNPTSAGSASLAPHLRTRCRPRLSTVLTASMQHVSLDYLAKSCWADRKSTRLNSSHVRI